MMAALRAQHILKLSAERQREFVNSFDVVFCDCDGVMWLIAAPLPHTGDAVNTLKANGKQVIFVTNNSIRTDDEYVKLFSGIGVKNFQKNDIIHPAKSMIYYLKKHNIKQPVFSLCGTASNTTLRSGGIDVRTLDVTQPITTATLPEITEPKEKVGAVLFDINMDLNYTQMVAGTRYLADKDCQFLAGGTDWLLPMTPNLTVPGFCDFLETIQRFTKRPATILSKPSLLLGEIVKDIYQLKDPKRCLFVGDSLTHDIRFGLGCGFQTLLVLSGSTPIEEMLAAPVEDQPHYYADGISDFLKLYENIGKNA
ncbi:phosphoglycolate phosphatase 2 [Ceratitis capitata]|uniref:phosphoglycolate phosphatase 2 n=1 Tax=Ceratitis capitata TaxID=7213 RepID=UPI00032A2941|nr:phosphoglycolate phosphatase 2 [Ceratitis capitata]